jgi:rod shape-determining protein MreD
VRTAAILVAIAGALVLQSTMARFVIRDVAFVDFVLVVVVVAALTAGPFAGLLTGTVGGLVQDALSGGIVGIGGLAKTVVGFLTGVVSLRFIITRPIPRFIVCFVASVAHAAIFIGVHVLLDLSRFSRPYAAVAVQGVGNGLVGWVAFQLLEGLPASLARRRLGGRIRLRARRLD